MRRMLAFALMFLVFAPHEARAVTSREILELSKAGLSDEVLLALIEMDGGVFTLDTETLTALKKAGVSDRVILAMVRSGRSRPAAPLEPEPAADQPLKYPDVAVSPPQVIVIERERPVVQEVPVFVPVYGGTIFGASGRAGIHGRLKAIPGVQPVDPSPGFGAPFPYSQPPYRPARTEPVYWGWGGKLRPDAWQPVERARPDHGKSAPRGGRRD